MICVLAGGVGAAKFLAGLRLVVDPSEIVVIGNVADDMVLHGLHISPDLDTITYTLAGQINPETGWGLRDESWQAMENVRRYGGESWFGLGDRDIGTHMFRTQRLSEGATLTQVTDEIIKAWDLRIALLPATNDPLATKLELLDGSEIDFQEYFVGRQHQVTVRSVRFAGADRARPGPGVLAALNNADHVIIAPSNPIVSIGPLLAVDGIAAALEQRRDSVSAISPIVGGKALKGPADRLLRELGHSASVTGVATIYAHLAATLVIDTVDEEASEKVRAAGMQPLITDTIMHSPQAAATLATTILENAI